MPDFTSDHKGTRDPAGTGILPALERNSLKLTGLGYMVADASLFASGIAAGDRSEAVTGLLYSAGGLVCEHYGNPSANRQAEMLSRQLGDHLTRRGTPPVPGQEWVKRESTIEHVEDFLSRHPSQILNGLFTVAAGSMIHSGISKKKPYNTVSGLLVGAGALAGLLIPQKDDTQPDDAPHHGRVGALVDWAEHKPLAIASTLYLANNGVMFLSARDDQLKNPASRAPMFKYLAAGTYLFANGALALSSKDNQGETGEKRKALEEVMKHCAPMIAVEPEPLRQALIEDVSGFLARSPGAVRSADEIKGLLEAKLAELTPSQVSAAAPANWQARARAIETSPSSARV